MFCGLADSSDESIVNEFAVNPKLTRYLIKMIKFKKARTGHDFIRMKFQVFYFFIVAKAFDFYKLNKIYENCVDGKLL